MTSKKIATIALGLAMAAPLGLATPVSAATILKVYAVAGCPCSATNPLGTLPATTLLKNTKTKSYLYDFTFDIANPLGSSVTSQSQATLTTKSGATIEMIDFSLFTNIGTAAAPVAGTSLGSSSLAFASVLNVPLAAGHYFLQVDYIAANRETLSGGVTVNPVPEPASWALVLVGFGALGGAMRARRKAAAVA